MVENSSSIKRNALNQGYSLGSLYNSTRDEFVGPNLYRINELSKFTTRVDVGSNKYFDFFEEKTSDKFKHFDIDASLSLSVMAGALKVSGNAQYLSQEKETNKKLKWNVGLIQRTCEETLNIFDKNLKNLENISQEDLQVMVKCGATHFVIGVEWGVQVTANIEFEEMEHEEQEQIKGSLSVSFKKPISIEGKAEFKFDNSIKEKMERTNLTLISDCQPYLDTGLVTNVNMFSKYLCEVPKLIKLVNGGKGVPMKYTLFPIKEYLYDLNLRIETIFLEIGNSTINTIQEYFDKFIECKVQVNDYLKDCKKFANMFKKDIKFLSEQSQGLTKADIVFKEEISKSIIEYRSGQLKNQSNRNPLLINLESILNKIGKFNPDQFLSDNEELFSRLSNKITYLKLMQKYSNSSKNELHFVEDFNSQNAKFILRNKDMIIISLDFAMINIAFPENLEILNYFLSELKNENRESIFLVIDYEVDLNSFKADKRPIRPIFKYFKEGKLKKVVGK